MLNKKILATAVAVAFSSSAFGAINLTTPNNDRVLVASEALAAADFNGDGFVVMTNSDVDTPAAFDANGTADEYLSVVSVTGFTIGGNTSKYIRVDLEGGEFGSAPSLWVGGTEYTIAQGGQGESFALYEVDPTNTVADDAPVVLEAETYFVNPAGSTTVTIATYNDAPDAVAQQGALYSDSETFTTVASVVTGNITTAATSIATVRSNFLLFDDNSGDAISTLVGTVGSLDTSRYVTPGSVDNLGADVTNASVLTTEQNVAVEGDFSFGTWTLNSSTDADDNLDCGVSGVEVELDLNTAKTVATSAELVDVIANEYAVCVEVPGVTATAKTIKKGTYSLEIQEDEIEGALGSIAYNTVSVDVPYITTFSDYNQRLYIVNNGNQDAVYTMTFTSEDGTTATPAGGAAGTVPAGEMVVLTASEVVTITGDTTRTSAVLEIEAEAADVSVASQSVNRDTGGTDTSILQ